MPGFDVRMNSHLQSAITISKVDANGRRLFPGLNREPVMKRSLQAPSRRIKGIDFPSCRIKSGMTENLRRSSVYEFKLSSIVRWIKMKFLASLFVGKPFNIFSAALIFFIGYLTLRCTVLGGGRHPGPLLAASIAWALYAAWEWLVLIRTPEANIRVDLLIIWPALAIFSAWAIYRSLK